MILEYFMVSFTTAILLGGYFSTKNPKHNRDNETAFLNIIKIQSSAIIVLAAWLGYLIQIIWGAIP